MGKRLVYIGYRLDEPRYEAVGINARQYRRLAQELGWSCQFVTYAGPGASATAWLDFLDRLASVCRAEPNVVVHDFFVLPGLSLVAQLRLRAERIAVRYVKTYINPPGTADLASGEGLLRLALNNGAICRWVARLSSRITHVRPIGLARFGGLQLPLRFPPGQVTKRSGPLRVAYLGHALRKKGAHLLPRIVQLVRARRPGQAVFRFCFSPLGDARSLRRALAAMPGCEVVSETQPDAFFARADVFLLPMRHAFAAAGTFNTVWEAMSAGCCVLTRRMAVLPEVVSPASAELVDQAGAEPFAEALVRLIDDPASVQVKRRVALAEYTRHYTGRREAIRAQLQAIYG